MTVRWLVAALHLVALGIGLGAVWMRGRALRGPLDDTGIRRALWADNLWGIAFLVWLGTGVARAFGGLDKGTIYYLHNDFFLLKMALFVAVLALEVKPMIALIGWRIRSAKGQPIDTSGARTFATISVIQSAMVVAMIFAATAMARGLGMRG